MSTHACGPIETESEETRACRAEFTAWMIDNYPGLKLEAHPNSGYYADKYVNCCWEIWLYKSKLTR